MGHPYWPIFDIEIRTPKLVLRAVDDELAVALADVAARGVHDPEFAPFTTGAWHDNGASLGVTHSLGYEHVGAQRAMRRDEPGTLERFRMTRSHFAGSVRRDNIEIVGDAAVRALLGIARPV